jgi:hypothetical protein
LPLKPRKEALNNPASFVATQAPSILGLPPRAVRFMRGNHLDAFFSKLRVEGITVVRAIADQILWRRLDHAEIETQLHERHIHHEARWPDQSVLHPAPRRGTGVESADARSCSSDNTSFFRSIGKAHQSPRANSKAIIVEIKD